MKDDRRKHITPYGDYVYYYMTANGSKARGWRIEGHAGIYSTEAVVKKIIDTVSKK